MYSHNLPLETVIMLWSCFHALILRAPIRNKDFVSSSALWNRVQQLHYIDGALNTSTFKPFISQRTPHGFRRVLYSSSDDSEHYDRNHHVVVCSTNSKDDECADQEAIQPSYRHVTSSVSAIKSENATVNSAAIVNIYGPYHSSFYGDGTNDNAGDAQKEIRTNFDNIMRYVQDSDMSAEQIHNLLFENGVLRRVIAFGDPFHVANLTVTWASIYAFGDTKKANHSQVHHLQLCRS